MPFVTSQSPFQNSWFFPNRLTSLSSAEHGGLLLFLAAESVTEQRPCTPCTPQQCVTVQPLVPDSKPLRLSLLVFSPSGAQ